MLLDLVECSLGKEWYQNTESATAAFPAIYDALKDPEKEQVVVICHSQGTIIMAVVLRALKALAWHRRQRAPDYHVTGARLPQGPVPTEPGAPSDSDASADALTASAVVAAESQLPVPAANLRGLKGDGEPIYVLQDEVPLNPDDFEPLTDQEWAKLEIYCFANCANEMRYRWQPAADGVRPPDTPYIESFANEHDFVARLGMLAPDPAGEHIRIDGPFYVQQGARGTC